MILITGVNITETTIPLRFNMNLVVNKCITVLIL